MSASKWIVLVFVGCWEMLAGWESTQQAAWADVPNVRFDMPYLLEARDVTSEEFAQSHPEERLYEIRFPISTFLTRGSERDLTELLYQIEGPQAQFEIADYLPKTTLETRYAGPIQLEDSSEKGQELKVDLSGNYLWVGSSTLGGKAYSKSNSGVKASLLPPLEAVSASGTIQRQRGVYFRLHSTPQTWLEGEREFATILRVPADWRGDFVVVRCRAEAEKKSVVSIFNEKVTAGSRDFIVGLYVAQDAAARATVTKFIHAEAKLRQEAVSQKSAIERNSHSTLSHWGLELPGDRPRIPADWQTRLLVSPVSVESIPDRLPSSVQQAARNFLESRVQMAKLAGRSTVVARHGLRAEEPIALAR